VTSPEEAKVAAGISGSGAERLQGRGDFLLVLKGHSTRFCAAYVPAVRAQEAAQTTRRTASLAAALHVRAGCAG
jgi:hypothetical protein